MNNPKQLQAQKFVRRNLIVQSQGRTEKLEAAPDSWIPDRLC